MSETNTGFTRRDLMLTAAAAAAATSLPIAPARAAAKYTRYNVTSPRGKQDLASYAKGVQAMLKLPADHPHNWFRNSFVHLMDCPHGNWWFYVWHRGYIGYFEQTIRSLSGDPNFALPYWDWTQLPQIPEQMFEGVLTPADAAFAPYTKNLAVFQSFIKAPLSKYFGSLNAAQQAQLKIRGYSAFDLLWNDVTGFSPTIIQGGAGISGNMAYANPCGSRYLSPDNPKFNAATAKTVSEPIIKAGLEPVKFYDPVATASFTSSKTPSHNSPPGTFSVLEGMPHNQVHNYIGGVGPLDPGPYGNMTNFLSPVDPIFFLHHANMDRLWDVWTRKQMALKLPYLPPQPDLKTLSDEPFLFFVDGQGNYVINGKAGDYLSTTAFDYDYEPATGDDIISRPVVAKNIVPLAKGTAKGNTATVAMSRAALEAHVSDASQRTLAAQVTLPHPGVAGARSFDVLVNAPAGVEASADSPFFAGTIAFFGAMSHSHDATFVVPLPKQRQLLMSPPPAIAAERKAAAPKDSTPLTIRLVPSGGQAGPAPVIKAISVGAM